MVLSVVFITISIYSIHYLKKHQTDKRWHSIYTSTVMLFDLFMMIALLSTHIGLYWVLLEATTLLTAPLIYFNKTKHSLEATWKYVFICSIGIAIAFIGIILLSITFQNAQSLFFSEFYSYTGEVSLLFLKISFLFLLVGFGTKMGLAPLHFWLPDAHSESPSPVSAMLSAALLNTALIGILRLLKVMYIFDLNGFAGGMLIIMGFLSLFVSAVFIVRIKNFKRIFAYSSIENMGIIAIAIGLGGLGMFAGFLHIVSHSLLKTSAFLTSGNIIDEYKTKNFDETGNVINEMKYSGPLMFASILGLLAVPPSLSFLSEFNIILRMYEKGGYYMIVVFSLLLTVVFYGFARMSVKMLFGEKKGETINRENLLSTVPQIFLLLIVFILGFYLPDFIKNMLLEAAQWIGG